MKVYVAGRTTERERVRQMQNLCRLSGHEITFDWTTTEEEGGEGGIKVDWSTDTERARRIAQRELEACYAADLVILMWEANPTPGKQGMVGALFETAFGIAYGKQVWIVGPTRDSVFFYLPNITVMTETEARARMRSESIWRNGSKVEVIPGMQRANSGPHPVAEHLDEVELMKPDKDPYVGSPADVVDRFHREHGGSYSDAVKFNYGD